MLGCRVAGLSLQSPFSNFLRHAPSPLPPPLHTDNLLLTRSEYDITVHVYKSKLEIPRQPDLILHGFEEAAATLLQFRVITIGYRNGSCRHLKRSGFAAVIDDPEEELTL